MTAKQFNAALCRLGLSMAEAAVLLRVTPRAVRYWLSDERTIPEPVAMLIRLMLAKKITVKDLQAA